LFPIASFSYIYILQSIVAVQFSTVKVWLDIQ